MKLLITVFWNTKQNRIRAGFRILLQLIAFLGLLIGLKFLLENLTEVKTEITGRTVWWYFLILASFKLVRVFLSSWLAGRFLDRRLFADFGFHINKNWWIDFGFGMGLGLLLMSLIFGVELIAGWITISDTFHTVNIEQPFILSILVFFIFFLCVGIAEELFYRGYQLTNLAEGLNFKATGSKNAVIFAIVLSSVVFGLGHLASPNASPISTFNTILGGIMFATGFILTGELSIPIGLHITWNFFQANVFGFPVSSNTFPTEAATFVSIEQGGPNLWTGGNYGPEAGLIGFFAMILGVILIVEWVRLRKGNNNTFIPRAEQAQN